VDFSVFNTVVAALPEPNRERLRDYIEVLIGAAERITSAPGPSS
jgi:hypothetical protein